MATCHCRYGQSGRTRRPLTVPLSTSGWDLKTVTIGTPSTYTANVLLQNMRKSSATLLGAVLATVFTVAYVHYAQQKEIKDLKKGVVRDIERQRLKQLQSEDVKPKEVP